MSTLLDIGTILKEAVYDVHSLSFSVNQEQAAQQNVIKAMQTAYGQALGLGSIKEIDTNQVSKEFDINSYSGIATKTGMVSADTVTGIQIGGVDYDFQTARRMDRVSDIQQEIADIFSRIGQRVSQINYAYCPPLGAAGGKAVIYFGVIGSSAAVQKLYFKENAVATNVSLSLVTLAALPTYGDYAVQSTYIEPDVSKPLKIVGLTVDSVALTLSNPTLTTDVNIKALITTMLNTAGYTFRAIELSYVKAAANNENSFFSLALYGFTGTPDSVELLIEDVTPETVSF